MILKLWIFRLHETRIWFIHSTTRRSTNTFRLLDTDNRIVLPINSPIRIILTAADVLHSWTVPRLGVKTDATPGRLNQIRFSINRPGLLCGQRSEYELGRIVGVRALLVRASYDHTLPPPEDRGSLHISSTSNGVWWM